MTLSETRMMQALRTGNHATVYEVRRDPNLKNKDIIRDRNKPVFPFVGGSQYKGEWQNDQKEGFGIQVNPDKTKYEGEWQGNYYHGRGTLWIKKGKTYVRIYVGNWAEGRKEGQGINYYPDNSVYRGNWQKNEKSGNGTYEYGNGDQYIGEWSQDLQNGFGTMNYANGNIYEGLWYNGKKEGPGLFFYASTKKVYQGEWLDDQPKCGEFRSPTSAEELRFVRPLPRGIYFNDFKLPNLGLANAQGVLDLSISSTRMQSLNKSSSSEGNTNIAPVSDDILEKAGELFKSLSKGSDTLAVEQLGPILDAMGLQLDSSSLNQLMSQLADKNALYLSFADIIELVAYIQPLNSPQQDFPVEEDKNNDNF